MALDEMAGEVGRCVDRMSKETTSMLERVRNNMAMVGENLRLAARDGAAHRSLPTTMGAFGIRATSEPTSVSLDSARTDEP